MSKSVTIYRANNGYYCQDGDSVYIQNGSTALAEVVDQIQRALGTTEPLSMVIENIKVPALSPNQVQISPLGTGYIFFTTDTGYVFSDGVQLKAMIAELIHDRIIDYREGSDYLLTIPLDEPKEPAP